MEGIIQFFKFLFLSNAFLLTPAPIDLDDKWIEITLKKPLTAITVGAAVQVKLKTTEKLFGDSKGFMTDWEIADGLIPNGTIRAELTDTQGNVLMLSNRSILLGNEYVIYVINDDEPFPIGVEYTKLRIKSIKPIHGVEIYWKNYRL